MVLVQAKKKPSQDFGCKNMLKFGATVWDSGVQGTHEDYLKLKHFQEKYPTLNTFGETNAKNLKENGGILDNLYPLL